MRKRSSHLASYHKGELAAQDRAGFREHADHLRPIISDRLPRGARDFLADLRFLVVGATAPDGQMWASMVYGQPGFLQAPSRGAHRSAPFGCRPAGGGLGGTCTCGHSCHRLEKPSTTEDQRSDRARGRWTQTFSGPGIRQLPQIHPEPRTAGGSTCAQEAPGVGEQRTAPGAAPDD